MSKKDVGDGLSELRETWELNNSNYDVSRVASVIWTVWKVLVASLAMCELTSFVLAAVVDKDEDDDAGHDEGARHPRLMFWRKEEESLSELSDTWVGTLIGERNVFGALFCLVWFVDCFVTAEADRREAAKHRRRQQLLEAKDEEKDQQLQQSQLASVVAYIRETAEDVFFLSLIWNLSLLPVGFFILSEAEFRWMWEWTTRDEEDVLDSPESGLKMVRAIRGIFRRQEESEDELVLDAIDSDESKFSYPYLTLLHVRLVVATFMGKLIRRVAKRFVGRMAKLAIRNPFKFRRRIKGMITAVRWAKYLAPLVGTSNKLKGNVMDLIKKYRQEREARIARRLRDRIWKDLSEEERREKAAILIQSNFRRLRSKRAAHAVRLFFLKKRDAAALRLQSILRAKAKRARAAVREKMNQLKALHDKAEKNRIRMKLSRQSSAMLMSDEERHKMYELEEEFQDRARKLKEQKMLLRPNTRFAVTWKIIFVSCVLIEISEKIMAPKLAKYVDKKTGEKLSLDQVFVSHLVPTPLEDWDQCVEYVDVVVLGLPRPVKRKADRPKEGESNGIPGREFLHRMTHPLEVLPTAAEIGKRTSWYCFQPYRFIQRVYIWSLTRFITDTLWFVSMVHFFDVFITFFTGELNDGGTLVPKPFFTRWILPGIALQLIVNPMMAEVATGLRRLAQGIHNSGPARVWRWWIAFLYPAAAAFLHFVEWRLWLRFVQAQNQKQEEQKQKSTQNQKEQQEQKRNPNPQKPKQKS